MRRIACLIAFAVAIAFASPATWITPDASAAVRTAAKKSQKKSGKHQSKKRSHRSVAPDTRNLAQPDDPKLPLEAAWKAQLNTFLGRERPEFSAFVALNPLSGRIMVLSERSSNPKKVSHPATSAMFPAASVFKMVTAAALVEEAGVSPNAVMCYHGGQSRLTEDNIRDAPKRDKSCRSLSDAFAHSTNAVFAKMALKHLGAAPLFKWAERLGFNQAFQWEGLSAKSLFVKPVGSLAIGQTAAGFTNSNLAPLHAAMMAVVFASGGMVPAAFASWFPGSTPVEDSVRPDTVRVVTEATAAALRSMMVAAATQGTASKHLASVTGGPAAVKTGTLSSRDGSGLLNTWMVGYYPATRPEFAFAAVVATRGSNLRAGHLTRFALESFVILRKARAPSS